MRCATPKLNFWARIAYCYYTGLLFFSNQNGTETFTGLALTGPVHTFTGL